MPKLGEIKRGREIEKKPKDHKFVWRICEGCGKGRWVDVHKNNSLCLSCCRKGAKNGRWKNGASQRDDGYITVLLQPDDFFYPMANPAGRVLAHRLVMAKHLSRCLHPWEIVHHINGNTKDNRINNLKLTTHSDHKREHDRQRKVKAGIGAIPGIRIFEEETLRVNTK